MKNKYEECETWIDRFRKLENALYLCDLSNTGEVWRLERMYLPLCVLVWKRTPHFLSLLHKHTLGITHVPGTVLSTIRKYKVEADVNFPSPGYLQFLCVSDPFTILLPESNPQSDLVPNRNIAARLLMGWIPNFWARQSLVPVHLTSLFSFSCYYVGIFYPFLMNNLPSSHSPFFLLWLAFSNFMPSIWAVCLSSTYLAPFQLPILSTWLINA